jgi:hypothetical protein
VKKLRPAEIRFYLDADVLGLAHALGRLRSGVTYPGDKGAIIKRRERPPCEITPEVKDPVWIPLVASRGWLVITRDRHIQDHRAEIAAVRDYGAKMVALSGPEARGTFEQLEILMCRWRDIEVRVDEPGPFIYTATRTSLQPVDIG